MKIIHIITGLEDGGAEGVLYRLVTNDEENKHVVISLMDEGKYGVLLQKQNIKVYTLNMNEKFRLPVSLFNLTNIMKLEKPDVVQTWMSHADLIGGIVAKISGNDNIVWNIRHTKLNNNLRNLKTNAVIYTNMALSKFLPKKIICCSYQTYEDFEKNGYDSNKMVVINNGYDFTHFYRDSELRSDIRAKLNIPEDMLVFGRVARYGVNKNHLGLLESMSLIKDRLPEFKLLLVGKGLDNKNIELVKKIEELDLSTNVILLGQRNDIPSIMNALDIHISNSSSGEGFPNALTEAMACGTVCIATDVGDSKYIIGDNGWIVQPSDSKALGNAILSAVTTMDDSLDWEKLISSSESHIKANFSLSKMISKYNTVWKETITPV